MKSRLGVNSSHALADPLLPPQAQQQVADAAAEVEHALAGLHQGADRVVEGAVAPVREPPVDRLRGGRGA